MVLKKIILILILFFVIGNVYAIQINEVSPKNPEYIEIYNSEKISINLREISIKDNSDNKPDTLSCGIENCSMKTDSDYFLIIGKSTDIEDILEWDVEYYFVDDQKIGNGLNDDVDSLTISFGDLVLDNFSYESSKGDKSWQRIGNDILSCIKTPGLKNECDEEQKEVATETTPTPTQNQNNQQNSNPAAENQQQDQKDARLMFPEEINADQEFEVNVYLYGFEKTNYDVKIFVYNEEEKPMSEIYDKNKKIWISSNYYVLNSIQVDELIERQEFKLKLKEEFFGFDNRANLVLRIRKNSETNFDEYSSRIKINEAKISKNQNSGSDNADMNSESLSKISGDVIHLNKNSQNKNSEKSLIYISPNEKIKLYSIYGFSFFCLIVILILLIKKQI